MNSITDRFEIQICASPLDAKQNAHRDWRTAFYCETIAKAQMLANVKNKNVRVLDTKEGIILKPSRPVIIQFHLPEARIG